MLLSICANVFACFVTAYLYVVPARVKCYYAKNLKKMSEEHKKAFGTDKLPYGGFPDTGNGRISDILDYKQWVTINSA